jgi:hypothetical protein
MRSGIRLGHEEMWLRHVARSEDDEGGGAELVEGPSGLSLDAGLSEEEEA